MTKAPEVVGSRPKPSQEGGKVERETQTDSTNFSTAEEAEEAEDAPEEDGYKPTLEELADPNLFPEGLPMSVDRIATKCGIPEVHKPYLYSLWASARADRVPDTALEDWAKWIARVWESHQVYPEQAASALNETLLLGLRDHAERKKRLAEPNRPDAGEIELSTVLDSLEPAVPGLLSREDGKGLLYPGRTHVFFGQPESGKTWLALYAATDVVREAKRLGTGHPVVVFVDFEDSPSQFVRRLALLGTDPYDTARFCAYFSPTSLDAGVISAMAGKLVNAVLVIVDSTNEAMAASGLDPNSNADSATFRQQAINTLVSVATKAALVSIDHEGHARNSRVLGGTMKRAAVTGAEFLVRAVQQPAPGKEGRLAVYVTKDREGAVRAVARPAEEGSSRQHVANLALSPNPQAPVWHKDRKTPLGAIDARLWSPVGATSAHPVDLEAADAIMAAVRELEAEGRTPASKNKIFDRVRANGTKRDSGALRVAVEWVARETWLASQPGPGGYEVFGLGVAAASGQLPSTVAAGSSGGAAVGPPRFVGDGPANSSEPQAPELRPANSSEPTPLYPKEPRPDGPKGSLNEFPANSSNAHPGGSSLLPPPLGGSESSGAPGSEDSGEDGTEGIRVDPGTGVVLFGEEEE